MYGYRRGCAQERHEQKVRAEENQECSVRPQFRSTAAQIRSPRRPPRHEKCRDRRNVRDKRRIDEGIVKVVNDIARRKAYSDESETGNRSEAHCARRGDSTPAVRLCIDRLNRKERNQPGSGDKRRKEKQNETGVFLLSLVPLGTAELAEGVIEEAVSVGIGIEVRTAGVVKHCRSGCGNKEEAAYNYGYSSSWIHGVNGNADTMPRI